MDRRQRDGVQFVGRRRDDRDVVDARDDRRDDAHDRTRGVRCRPARHVDSDPLDRPKPPAEFPSGTELAAPVLGELGLVELPDVVRGRLDRLPNIALEILVRALARVSDIDVAQLDVVELARKLANRDVAFLVYAVDDLPYVVADRVDTGVTVEERGPIGRSEVGEFPYVHSHTIRFVGWRKNGFLSPASGLIVLDRPDADRVQRRPDEQVDDDEKADDRERRLEQFRDVAAEDQLAEPADEETQDDQSDPGDREFDEPRSIHTRAYDADR